MILLDISWLNFFQTVEIIREFCALLAFLPLPDVGVLGVRLVVQENPEKYMVATKVPAAANRSAIETASGKMEPILIQARFRLPYRLGLSGQATASLRVTIGVCVTGHPHATSNNSGDDDLGIAVNTLFFTIVVMATSR